MTNTKRTGFAAGMIGALGLAWLVGCSSTPSRVDMVDIDPDDAAAQAMSQYDANKDGKLADDELRAVPGILKWKQLYDSDVVDAADYTIWRDFLGAGGGSIAAVPEPTTGLLLVVGLALAAAQRIT